MAVTNHAVISLVDCQDAEERKSSSTATSKYSSQYDIMVNRTFLMLCDTEYNR